MATDPRTKRIATIAIGAAAIVLVIAVIVGVYATGKPAFYAQYKHLAGNARQLTTSAHRELVCGDCHADSRGPIVHQAALVGDFYRGLVGKRIDPVFFKMERPTNDACLKCHREDWSMDAKRTSKLPHPAHLRVATETRECVGCHKWTAHEETYMQKHKAMPFSRVCASFGCHVGFKQKDECKNCHHVLQDTKGPWRSEHPKTVRAAGANGCLESCHEVAQCRLCHQTGKTPVFKGPAVQTGVQLIEVKHVRKDWLSQHGTFALADQSKCMLCHVSIGECQHCHTRRPAFHGSQATWIGRHKKVAKGHENRCLACHKKPFCDDCHAQFKEMR